MALEKAKSHDWMPLVQLPSGGNGPASLLPSARRVLACLGAALLGIAAVNSGPSPDCGRSPKRHYCAVVALHIPQLCPHPKAAANGPACRSPERRAAIRVLSTMLAQDHRVGKNRKGRMDKRPREMTHEELQAALERAELAMWLAADFAETEAQRDAAVAAKVGRIRAIRQEIAARQFRGSPQ